MFVFVFLWSSPISGRDPKDGGGVRRSGYWLDIKAALSIQTNSLLMSMPAVWWCWCLSNRSWVLSWCTFWMLQEKLDLWFCCEFLCLAWRSISDPTHWWINQWWCNYIVIPPALLALHCFQFSEQRWCWHCNLPPTWERRGVRWAPSVCSAWTTSGGLSYLHCPGGWKWLENLFQKLFQHTGPCLFVLSTSLSWRASAGHNTSGNSQWIW